MNELTLKIRSLIDRITLNKLTATFFLFGFFHCFAQGIIQSLLFSADYTYYSLINDIIAAGDVPAANHTFFVGQTLRICDYLPHDDTTCEDVYTLGERQDIVANVISTRAMNRRDIHDGVKITSSDIVAFPVSLEMKDSQTVQLSERCISTLLFPHQDLANSRRENLAFIFMQFWLFGISVLAMIYDSVPHIMAGIGARILLTAWSAYSIWRTIHQEGVYASLLSDPGTPCSMDFFPNYFGRRTALEIPDLVLNCTALIIMVWTLLRVYAVQSYKCLGAPNHILSMQKLYMALQACLHLEVYILLAGMGLWIDQLFNTYIRDISTNTKVYEGVFFLYTLLVVPWTGLGWYTIRYEKRRLMYIFLGIGFLFLFAACMMFYSQVFRWTFFMWPNLGCYTVAYMILMVACITLGVVCLRNFGKGLAQYLHAESVLEKSHFAPEVFDVEKGGREEVRREVHEEQDQPVPLHSVQALFKAGDFEDRPISTYYLPTLHVSDTGPGGVVAVKRA